MCGRYYIPEEEQDEELWAIMEILNRRPGAENIKLGEVFPRDTVPVIANNRLMRETPFAMTWGYTLPGGKSIINARSETAKEKPLFREGIEQHRCLLPAGHYFEWENREKEKIKYAIRPAFSGLFYLAGIYRLENGQPRFTILTRAPAENISFIHDRMPVILPREMKKDWLDPRFDAGELLQSAVLNVRYEPA